MRGFEKRKTLQQARELLRSRTNVLEEETVSLESSFGRVTSRDVISTMNLPHFSRSAMDGYALRAQDTFGAGENNPLKLELVGEITAGDVSEFSIEKGQAARIMTGAPLPKVADAVLPAEFAVEEPGYLVCYKSVTPGKNVSKKGEDLSRGSVAVARGTRILAQHMGLLAAIGISAVLVIRRPAAKVIPTGDEIVSDIGEVKGCQTVDSGSVIIEAMLRQGGCSCKKSSIVPDDCDRLMQAIDSSEEDMVIILGGTSVGKKDIAPHAVEKLGELALHGIAIRPGAPTGIGFVKDKPVFLLVGNPAGAMIGYYALVDYCLRLMQGLKVDDSEALRPSPRAVYKGRLTRKITSCIGRTDFVRVRVTGQGVDPVRVSGAGILSSMTRSDGIVVVAKNKEGYDKEETVEVELY